MIANTSKKQYLTTYRNLIKKSGSENIEEIYKYIRDANVKDTTKLSYLNSIISLKKHDPSLVSGNLDDMITHRDKLNVKIEDERKNDNLNEKQRNAMEKITMDGIKQFIVKLNEKKDKSAKDMENYVLIKLMSQFPIRNDLQEIFITNFKSDTNKPCNTIYIPNGKKNAIIYLKEYKTAKTNGTISLNLDDELTKDIKKLVKDGRTYLFQNNKGEPLSSSLFTHKLNNLFMKEFNVPISSTIIRKIYLTNKYKDVIGEMKQDAKIMGHNLDTQRQVYIDNK